MEKGEYIMQEDLLQDMFYTFSDSLNALSSKKRLQQNYEKQLDSYSKLFEKDRCAENEETRTQLICARCLISATRSLLCGGYLNENIPTIKQELNFLLPLFSGKRMTKTDLSNLIDNRILRLTPKKSDEMVDAVLFMYISMAPHKTQTEEKSLERSVL